MAGSSWGTREELLHPRDRKGRFRDKWSAGLEKIEEILRKLAAFNEHMFGSDQEASDYIKGTGRELREGRRGTGAHRTSKRAVRDLLTDYDGIQSRMRSGKTTPSDKTTIAGVETAMEPSDRDLALSRIVPAESFGLTPQTLQGNGTIDKEGNENEGIKEWTGDLISDRAFGAYTIGTPIQSTGQNVRMIVAAPKGTRMVHPPDTPEGDRQLILAPDQPLQITKVKWDEGERGWHMYAIAVPHSDKETPKPIGGPEAPAARQAVGEANLPEPQQAVPGGPPVRDGEPVVSEAVGGEAPGVPGAPEQMAPIGGPAPTPAPGSQETPLPYANFREELARRPDLTQADEKLASGDYRMAILELQQGKDPRVIRARMQKSVADTDELLDKVKRKLDTETGTNVAQELRVRQELRNEEIQNDQRRALGKFLDAEVKKLFPEGEREESRLRRETREQEAEQRAVGRATRGAEKKAVAAAKKKAAAEVGAPPAAKKAAKAATPAAPKRKTIAQLRAEAGDEGVTIPPSVKKRDDIETFLEGARRGKEVLPTKAVAKKVAPPVVKKAAKKALPAPEGGPDISRLTDAQKEAILRRDADLSRNPGYPRNEEEVRIRDLAREIRGEPPIVEKKAAAPAKKAAKKVIAPGKEVPTKAAPETKEERRQRILEEARELRKATGAIERFGEERVRREEGGRRPPVKKAEPSPIQRFGEEERQRREAERARRERAQRVLAPAKKAAPVLGEEPINLIRLSRENDIDPRAEGVGKDLDDAQRRLRAGDDPGDVANLLRDRAEQRTERLDEIPEEDVEGPEAESLRYERTILRQYADALDKEKAKRAAPAKKAAKRVKKAVPEKAAPSPIQRFGEERARREEATRRPPTKKEVAKAAPSPIQRFGEERAERERRPRAPAAAPAVKKAAPAKKARPAKKVAPERVAPSPIQRFGEERARREREERRARVPEAEALPAKKVAKKARAKKATPEKAAPSPIQRFGEEGARREEARRARAERLLAPAPEAAPERRPLSDAEAEIAAESLVKMRRESTLGPRDSDLVSGALVKLRTDGKLTDAEADIASKALGRRRRSGELGFQDRITVDAADSKLNLGKKIAPAKVAKKVVPEKVTKKAAPAKAAKVAKKAVPGKAAKKAAPEAPPAKKALPEAPEPRPIQAMPKESAPTKERRLKVMGELENANTFEEADAAAKKLRANDIDRSLAERNLSRGGLIRERRDRLIDAAAPKKATRQGPSEDAVAAAKVLESMDPELRQSFLDDLTPEERRDIDMALEGMKAPKAPRKRAAKKVAKKAAPAPEVSPREAMQRFGEERARREESTQARAARLLAEAPEAPAPTPAKKVAKKAAKKAVPVKAVPLRGANIKDGDQVIWQPPGEEPVRGRISKVPSGATRVDWESGRSERINVAKGPGPNVRRAGPDDEPFTPEAPAAKAAPVKTLDNMTRPELLRHAEANDIGGIRPSWNKERVREHIRQVEEIKGAPEAPVAKKAVSPIQRFGEERARREGPGRAAPPAPEAPAAAPARKVARSDFAEAVADASARNRTEGGFDTKEIAINNAIDEILEGGSPDEAVRKLRARNKERRADLDRVRERTRLARAKDRDERTQEDRDFLSGQERRRLDTIVQDQERAAKFIEDHFKEPAPAKKVAKKAARQIEVPLTQDEAKALSKVSPEALDDLVKSLARQELERRGLEPPTPAKKAVTPTPSPGTAAGKITAGRLTPGTRILVQQRDDGTWVPASKKTGAKAITFEGVDPVTGVSRQRLIVRGRDDDDNEIQVRNAGGFSRANEQGVPSHQTFFLEPPPRAAKAAKKTATPRKASPEDQVAAHLVDRLTPEARKGVFDEMTPEERTEVEGAIKRVEAEKLDSASLMKRLSDFDNPPSREEAHELIKDLNATELRAMARDLNVPNVSRLNKQQLRDEIVQGTSGGRLDSIATRGFKERTPFEAPLSPGGKERGPAAKEKLADALLPAADKPKATKSTPPARQDARGIVDALKTSQSREDAHQIIEKKKVAELREIAEAANVVVPSSVRTKADLQRHIIHATVGARIDSEAIRDLGKTAPGTPKGDIDPKDLTPDARQAMQRFGEERVQQDRGKRLASLVRGEPPDTTPPTKKAVKKAAPPAAEPDLPAASKAPAKKATAPPAKAAKKAAPAAGKDVPATGNAHIDKFYEDQKLTPREKEIDTRIREAYGRLRGNEDLPEGAMTNAGVTLHRAMRRGDYVALADLREELKDLPRNEVDDALRKMSIKDSSAFTTEATYNWAKLPRDDEAALRLGGSNDHFLKIDPPGRIGTSAKKAPDGLNDMTDASLRSLATEFEVPNPKDKSRIQLLRALRRKGAMNPATRQRPEEPAATPKKGLPKGEPTLPQETPKMTTSDVAPDAPVQRAWNMTSATGSIPRRERPGNDEPVRLINGGADQGNIHLDSEIGELWADLYMDDREPNSFINEIGILETDLSMRRQEPDTLAKAIDKLKVLKGRASSPATADRIQSAIDAMDAPEVRTPDLPDTVPDFVKKYLDELAKIPTARKTGSIGTENRRQSVLDAKVDAIRQIDAASGDRHELDRALSARDTHEGMDGSYAIWKLNDEFFGPGGKYFKEYRLWRRDAEERKEARDRGGVPEAPAVSAVPEPSANDISEALRESTNRALIQERVDARANEIDTPGAHKIADQYRSGLIADDEVDRELDLEAAKKAAPAKKVAKKVAAPAKTVPGKKAAPRKATGPEKVPGLGTDIDTKQDAELAIGKLNIQGLRDLADSLGIPYTDATGKDTLLDLIFDWLDEPGRFSAILRYNRLIDTMRNDRLATLMARELEFAGR